MLLYLLAEKWNSFHPVR